MMVSERPGKIELFFSYAHEDERLRNKLERQLSILKQMGQISTWHNRKINAGQEWEPEISSHLKNADIILLLVSPDFMASDYCVSIEIKEAMKRHEAGLSRVIPVILRPVIWEGAPFGKLQALPTDAKPITLWSNQDQAFLNVARGIRDAVTELTAISILEIPRNTQQKTKEQWIIEGNLHHSLKRYNEALDAFEQAIRLDPKLAVAYYARGKILCSLKRYDEALDAFEQAIRLDPKLAVAYNEKGNTLLNLDRYTEALDAFEQAIRLDPEIAVTYNNKGKALHSLRRYEEALASFEQALFLDPDSEEALEGKKYMLYKLKLEARTPMHFLMKKDDVLPRGYLSIEWDKRELIALRPDSYSSLRRILDDLWINYLFDTYDAHTHGKNWVIVSKSPITQRVIAPWKGLLKSEKNRPYRLIEPDWKLYPPEAYGLIAGTRWQIIGKLPIPTFGIASNKSELKKYALSLSTDNMYLKELLSLLEMGRFIPAEKVNPASYEFLMVFTSSKIDHDGEAIIFR